MFNFLITNLQPKLCNFSFDRCETVLGTDLLELQKKTGQPERTTNFRTITSMPNSWERVLIVSTADNKSLTCKQVMLTDLKTSESD